MDKHIAHNIVHRAYNDSSADCPICNGSTKLDEAPKLATQIIEDGEKKRLSMMTQAVNPAFYKEAEKAVTQFSESHVIDVLKFAEDGKLPEKIHLIPIGKWNTVKYGEIEVTKDMLKEMSDNFSKNLRAGNEAPIDIEHGESQYKDAAAGWIKEVKVFNDGLYATKIEWTDLGKELLSKKIYKYVSPEFHFRYTDPLNADETIPNVFIALSLVNRPLFRILKPLTASEGNLTGDKLSFILNSEPMELTQITQKQNGELTAEEREFLKVHASELTEEQKKAYGLSASEPGKENQSDTPKETPAAPAPQVVTAQEETVTIKASELDELKKFREQAEVQAKELDKKGVTETVDKLCFSEDNVKFKTDAKDKIVDFMVSLNKEQRVTFSEILEAAEGAKIFGEKGHEKDKETVDNPREALHIRANEIVKEKNLTYREAVSIAAQEHPEWAEFKDEATS